MADPETDRLILDPDAWTDAPQGVIETLKAGVARGLVIDASTDAPVPGQVAQLLLSARAAALAAGQSFRLADPSDAVRSSLSAIGLAALLLADDGANDTQEGSAA